MIKIVNGLVRATEPMDMPSVSGHVLWRGSSLETMMRFGGGVTIPAIDDKLADLSRRAFSLSPDEKTYWPKLRKDRDRLKRTQDEHEEMA